MNNKCEREVLARASLSKFKQIIEVRIFCFQMELQM